MDPPADGRPESQGGGLVVRAGEDWSSTSPARSHVAQVEVVVFTLDGREHALPVRDVVEVLRMVAVTPLPEAPGWVAGVINLRGRIVPVVDLRARLGMAPHEPDLSAPIIVVRAGEAVAGLVADRAVEVLALPSEAVEPPDRLTASAAAVRGVAREGDRIILVLDSERLCEGSAHLRLPNEDEEAREAHG